MFIAKDTRKLPDILADEKDDRVSVVLSRRTAELSGDVRRLTAPRAVARLAKMESLAMYDSGLTDLSGIGKLGGDATALRTLTLGRNNLAGLPADFAMLSLLETLWLDDNKLEAFPPAVLELPALRVLRLSGNAQLGAVPGDVWRLAALEELAVDACGLEALPETIGKLARLRILVARQNALEALPASVSALVELRQLQVNSNRLAALPDLSACVHLESLSVGSNKLATLPGCLAALPSLTSVRAAHNCLEALPEALVKKFGRPDAATGRLKLDGADAYNKEQAASLPEVNVKGNDLLFVVETATADAPMAVE